MSLHAIGLTLVLHGFSIKATNSTTILRLMRTINLVLATCTIVVGLLAWIFGKVTSFQKVIAGIYIMYVLSFDVGLRYHTDHFNGSRSACLAFCC